LTRDLTRRTTSADEIPAGLSTSTIAFMGRSLSLSARGALNKSPRAFTDCRLLAVQRQALSKESRLR